MAVLVADGFEQSEMVQPRQALDDVGAKTAFNAKVIEEIQEGVHGAVRARQRRAA